MSTPNVADRLYLRRRITNRVAIVMSSIAAIFGLFFLAWILWTTISKAWPASISRCSRR